MESLCSWPRSSLPCSAQTKINGVRMELSEIDAVLSTAPGALAGAAALLRVAAGPPLLLASCCSLPLTLAPSSPLLPARQAC